MIFESKEVKMRYILEVDPRERLFAGADRAAQAQVEGPVQAVDDAAAMAQHDTGADVDDAHSDVLRQPGRRLPFFGQ